MINNLPILFFNIEKEIFNNNLYFENLNKKDLCEDYLNSLIWTSHYYFKECINWKWKTKYHKTPFLKDLYHYCNNIDKLSMDIDDKEFTKTTIRIYITKSIT